MKEEETMYLWDEVPEHGSANKKPSLWEGMPEFIQEKKEPFSKIIFRFESEDDLNEFAELIGQKLTPKTKSAWYPFKPHRRSGPREVYK